MHNQQPPLVVLVVMICFSALALAQITTPTINWSRGFGTPSSEVIQQATSVTWANADKSAFFVCGQSSSTLVIDSVSIEIAEGTPTPYLLKFKTADRSLIWGRVISGSDSVGCEQVIVDEVSNEVYTLISGNLNWMIFKYDIDTGTALSFIALIPIHESGKIALLGNFLYFSGHATQSLAATLGCSGNAWIGSWSKLSGELVDKTCITAPQGTVRIASLITHKPSDKIFLTGSFDGIQLDIASTFLEQVFPSGTLFLASFEASDIKLLRWLKRIPQDAARSALELQSTSDKLFITSFDGTTSKSYLHFFDTNGDQVINAISYQNIILKSMAILSNDIILAGDLARINVQIVTPNEEIYSAPSARNPFVTAVKIDSTFQWIYTFPNSDSTTGQVSLVKDVNEYLIFGTTLNLQGYNLGPNRGLADFYMIGYKIPSIPPISPSPSIRPRPTPKISANISPVAPRYSSSSSLQPAISSKPIIIIPPVTYVQNVTIAINSTTNTVEKPILFMLNNTQIDITIDSNTTFIFPAHEFAAAVTSNQTTQSFSIEIVTQNLNLEQFSGVTLPTSYNVFEQKNLNLKVGEVIGNGVTISSSAFGMNNVEICAKVIRTQVNSAYNVFSFASKASTNDKYVNQRNASSNVYSKGAQICSRVSFSISSSRVDLVFPAKVQHGPSAASTPISSDSSTTGSIVVILFLVLQVLF